MKEYILTKEEKEKSLKLFEELEGDDIYAVGIFGLIFGRFDNLQG